MFEELDLQILKFINHPIDPIVNYFFIFLAYSIYPFLFYLAYYFYKHKQSGILSHLVVTAIIGFLIVSAIKYIVDRPRPYLDNSEIQNIIFLSDPSFPSRHTFTALLLSMFVPRGLSRKWKSSMFIYLAMIPITMMYIGVHYPSDILGGVIIGLLVPRIITEKLSTNLSERILSFDIKKLVPAS